MFLAVHTEQAYIWSIQVVIIRRFLPLDVIVSALFAIEECVAASLTCFFVVSCIASIARPATTPFGVTKHVITLCVDSHIFFLITVNGGR
jgi:hypothetical protein